MQTALSAPVFSSPKSVRLYESRCGASGRNGTASDTELTLEPMLPCESFTELLKALSLMCFLSVTIAR